MPRRGENIHKRKDGRWEARYIKGRQKNGKAIYGYLYAKTYRDVKQKLKDQLLKQESKSIRQRFYFNNIVEEWLEYKQHFIKESTYNKYFNSYINYIQKHLLITVLIMRQSLKQEEVLSQFLLEEQNIIIGLPFHI